MTLNSEVLSNFLYKSSKARAFSRKVSLEDKSSPGKEITFSKFLVKLVKIVAPREISKYPQCFATASKSIFSS
jgi:hypothetical protein